MESIRHLPLSGSGVLFVFGQDFDQLRVTYTRYSVIDVLQKVPALLLAAFSFLQAVNSGFSAFNFKLTAVSNLYTASLGHDSNKTHKRINLTTTQYLRLLCIANAPTNLSCRSIKKKRSKRAKKVVSPSINEGGEEDQIRPTIISKRPGRI